MSPAPFQGMTDDAPKRDRKRGRKGGEGSEPRMSHSESMRIWKGAGADVKAHPVESKDNSFLAKLGAGVGKLQAGAQTVAGKAAPVLGKVKAHAQNVNRNMERSGGGMGGGMGMDFGFTPFGGGLPSAPFGGMGMGPAPARAPRRSSGGSKGTVIHVHVGGSGKTTTKKPRRRKGGGGGSPAPWDPDFRLPY